MKSAKTTTILLITAIGALLWCVPVVINSILVFDQYVQGTGSLFLLAIGVAPYVLALIIAVVGPILLLRFRRESQALVLAGVMLGLWVPAALIWALGMGST